MSEQIYTALNPLPTIVDNAALVKRSIKDDILSGNINPLEFYRQAKIITEVLEELKKDPEIFDCAYTERERFGKEKAVINGTTFDIGQRATPDYKTCNDPVWNRLKQQIKDREALLKALKEPTTFVDPDTGEATTINPPSFSYSSFVTVKI